MPGPRIPTEKPFILIRKGGKDREEFKTLAGVLQSLGKDDVVEIQGNGPFVYGAIRLDGKALNLRAGPGYRPQFTYLQGPERNFLGVNAPVSVEGCDFRIGGPFADVSAFFGGGGEPWEFRSCRFLGNLNTNLGGYTGPSLRFVDCLISLSPFAGEPFSVSNLPGKKTELEMTNCIVWSGGNYFIGARDNGPMDITLLNNTMILAGEMIAGRKRSEASPLTVVAERNVFQVGGVLGTNPLDWSFPKHSSWKGKDNLYVGQNALLRHLREGKKEQWFRGLADWNKFLGKDEPGAREADWAYFAWDEARRQEVEPENGIAALKGMVEEARKKQAPGLKELGPAWELVGPGKAYLRALAGSGKPGAKADLRPEPPRRGPGGALARRQDGACLLLPERRSGCRPPWRCHRSSRRWPVPGTGLSGKGQEDFNPPRRPRIRAGNRGTIRIRYCRSVLDR